jgi:hypothetical protein
MPVLIRSALSYWLSMRMVRNGLSIEASMDFRAKAIPIEKMGAINFSPVWKKLLHSHLHDGTAVSALSPSLCCTL